MPFGTLRCDTIQSDGGTAKTVNDIVVSGGALGEATATTPTATDGAGTNDTRVATTKFVKDQLGLDNTWTGAQRGRITTVTQSTNTLEIDFDAGNNFYVLPSANISTINYTNLDAAHIGQSGSIFFQQPNSGNFTIGGWASTSRWAGGTGGSNNQPTFTATANTTDRVDYVIASTGNTTTDGDVVVQLVHTANYAE